MNSDEIVRKRVVHRVLEEKAKQHGNRDLFFFKDQVFGYEDFDQESSRVASGMQSLGLGKGDKVAIVSGNRPEYLFLSYGLSKIGAIQVPINTAHKGNILTYMIDHTDCRFLVVESSYLDRVGPILRDLPKIEKILVLKGTEADISALEKPVLDYETVMDNDGKYDEAEVLWHDPHAIIFTSGTTGPSKGVVLPNNYMFTAPEGFVQLGKYDERDCLYNPFPFFHVAGLSCILTALISGARMSLEQRFSVSRFWDDIKRHECTAMQFTGGIISLIYKSEPKANDRDNPLRVMIGANAPKDLVKPFEERFGVTILDTYGSTELGVCINCTPEKRKPGSCGIPRQDYDVRFVDDNELEVGTNTPGELLVRPKNPYSMFLEYYKMPDSTVEAWRNLWFHTGDYLSYDNDGFLYFVDRKHDALRRRGENISSIEVETVIMSHPAVMEAAALGVKSEEAENEVMVCVVKKPGHTVTPEELIAHSESRMAYFMVPRFVRFIEKMPKTPTERIEKYKLRDEGVTPDTWDREKAGYKLKR